ncbi:MAG TPA: hypothetical protein VIG32_05560 [Candidatus Baltobacteraceae bacterium]|jgi:hypothetical protein
MLHAALAVALASANVVPASYDRARSMIVYHVSDRLMTRVAIAPERVRFYPNATVYRRSGEEIARLLEAAEIARPVAKDTRVDARWLVEFYDRSGRNIGSISCDKFGGHGTIGGRHVAFSSDHFVVWLRSAFPY